MDVALPGLPACSQARPSRQTAADAQHHAEPQAPFSYAMLDQQMETVKVENGEAGTIESYGAPCRASRTNRQTYKGSHSCSGTRNTR